MEQGKNYTKDEEAMFKIFLYLTDSSYDFPDSKSPLKLQYCIGTKGEDLPLFLSWTT